MFEEIEKGSESEKNSYQSVWMARWIRTGTQSENSLRHFGEIQSDISGPSKQLDIMNYTAKDKDKQSSSSVKEGKLVDRVVQIHQGKRRATSCCIPSSAAAETEISQESMEKMKTPAFVSENSYAESRPLPNISGSASGIILYQSGSGNKKFEFERSASYTGSQIVRETDQLPGSDINQAENEPHHRLIHSTNLLGTTSIKSHPTSLKSSTPYRQLDSPNDPFISANGSSVSRDNHLRLQNFSGFKLQQFSGHSKSSELTKLEKLHDRYSSMPNLPPLVPKVETLRICASVDSVSGLSGWFPKFSQSTHVKFGKEDVVKNVGVASEIDVNAYLSSSSVLLRHGQQGVKIQSLGDSTDGGGNKNHEDSKDSEGNLKNTSSTETDVMDMNAFGEKCHTSGGNQLSLVKALNTNTMLFSSNKSRTEVGKCHNNKEVPDINFELSAANNRISGAVPSSSKTQSLDIDKLVSYPAQTNNSVSGPGPNILLKTDPSERWAKRLKSCALDTQGVGTQNFDLEDVSRKKMTRPSNMLTSELRGDNHIEILEVVDKSKPIQRINFTSSKDGTNRGEDLLLSQSWIQRWLRNQPSTPEKQSSALVLCEPQSSKLVLDDPPKKQFPSIAAMALMGKAMNGFQSCELQNRGPFVVWN